MDLSSLEGPPIADTRFAVQPPVPTSSIPSIPSIHIDMTIDTDTRPSTSDAFSRLNHKYNHYYHRNTDMDTDMPMATSRGRSRDFHGSRPAFLGEPWCETETRARAVSNPPSLCRCGGQGDRNGQLVWLDRERMWIVRSANTTTNTDTSMGRTPCSRSTSNLPLPTSHSHLGMGIDGDGDLPPAYGSHYEDRILASQPMASNRGQGQGRCEGLSRWGAVARRLNRR